MSGLPPAAIIRGPFLRLVADRMAALHRRWPVAFFLLDTNPGADWAEQQPWLEQALASSDAPWKVVVGHHPIYSAGRSGNNGPAITRLTPLFRRHEVQLYISGHEHHYEHTRPIAGNTYLVVGGGGAPLHPVRPNQNTAQPRSIYIFAEISVEDDHLRIQAWDHNGEPIDDATLVRMGGRSYRSRQKSSNGSMAVVHLLVGLASSLCIRLNRWLSDP